MKPLSIFLIVLGVLCAGLFGLMQFRTIGVNERGIAALKAYYLEQPSNSTLDSIKDSQDMVSTAKTLRTVGAIGMVAFIGGGIALRRRARKA